MKIGDIVYVRYRDHVLFKDVDPEAYGPYMRETIGWLAKENEDYIRIEWERSTGPSSASNVRRRATGLVILRSGILELRDV